MSRPFLQPVSLFQDTHSLEVESRHEIESRDAPRTANTPSPPSSDNGHPSVAQYYHQLQHYRRDESRDVVSPFSAQSDSVGHQPVALGYTSSVARLPVLTEQRADRSPTYGHMDNEALAEAQMEKPSSVHIRTGSGGSRAWMTVIGAWFVCFATLGMALSFGLFQAFYLRTHFPDRSPADIAWIGAAQVALMYTVGIIGNKAAANGYVHHLMIGGSFLYVLALFFVSISMRYWQVLLSQGVGCGFAMGLIFTPVVSTARQHMPHRPSIAAGIAVSGAAFGTLTFTIVLNYCLRNSDIGFPNSIRIAALIVAATLGIANVLIRTAPEQELQAAPLGPIRFTSIFKDLPYMFLVISTTLASLALYFPVFYLQFICELHDLKRDFAVYMFTIYAATFMFGRLSMDVFSSRLSPLKCLPTPYIASGLVTAGLLNLKHDPLVTLSIIAAVYGFSGGAVTSLVPAALAGFGDSREEVKLRNDVVHVLIGAAGLASGPAAGALLGRDFVWWLPIAFVTAMFAFAALFAMFGHFALKRQRSTERATTPATLPSTYPYPSVKFPTGTVADLAVPVTAVHNSHRNFGRLRGESLDQSPTQRVRSPSFSTKSERTKTWYTISPPSRTTELPELRFQIVTAPRRDA